MKKRAFLIHGWSGHPEEGWRPWLRDELAARGIEVAIPAMPDTDHPRMHAWLAKLKEAVGTPNEHCFFVGHSLGVITILQYLEVLKKRQQVGGAVLVAGFTDLSINVTEEDTSELVSFFQTPLDFEKVKKHCGKFVTIHSDNDPYVSLRHGEILRDKLGAKLIVMHNMKHFSGTDGITELPIALESVLKITTS